MKKYVIVALLILLMASMLSLANATDYQDVGIPAGQIKTITVNLQSGQTITGSFNITGVHEDVDFWVRDPTGAIILNSGTVTSPVNFEFKAGTDGAYVFNFDNTNFDYAKHVFMGYDVSGPLILGLDPMVFVVVGIVIGIILVIVAVALYRRSHAHTPSRTPPQQPPPPTNPGVS